VRFVFWLSLTGILFTYIGYPLMIGILARLRARPWKSANITPGVSIVVAVHNGMDYLPGKIRHLLGLDYPNIREIILVSDGSNDGTAELLAGLSVPRIKTIILEQHSGKAVAINTGVAAATAEIVLFVDIRPEIAPGSIQLLVSNFADPTVGCVAGELLLRQEGQDAAAEVVGGLYWRYEQWIRTREAAFDSPVGVYGGFYAIRRTAFRPLPAGIILDDMFEPLSIIRQGYRSVLDQRACVYDTWPKKTKGEFNRKVRTLAGNFQLFQKALWTLTPRNRTFFQLLSHKVMRLFVPYLLVLLLISSSVLGVHSALFAALAVLQTVGWLIALGSLRYEITPLRRIAAPAGALLMLNAAAVVGLYKFLFTRGPLWKIWNNSKSGAETSPEMKASGMPQCTSSEIAMKTEDDPPLRKPEGSTALQ
jgi:cellulose synthase/poly-beta-1,6-N-acetylglucosamine synthase-like glycosyltransferase